MRRLLTGGIKAILAIAALSTAAHWALRVQREPAAPIPAMASLPDPVTTGSIEPRKVERAVAAAKPEAQAPVQARGLDQGHLSALIASTTADKARPQKVLAKR
ncbi:hypothetical protein [Methylobacterium trifolii]|uniref:Uncharacterized protein n=1 Tax=Methylobacterium trifolii TaxID=1003092 RepID=A0ABQ4TT10_9HYPH|nr:hypothetical protein [Methylobacterium trifolii]GJE58454.1 hypothetical protein MPOCJGCO_0535 [Methylobacterium trifolii]